MWRIRLLTLVSVGCATGGSGVQALAAQALECDPGTLELARSLGPDGYQRRGDRLCEGKYGQLVGEPLRMSLASLTQIKRFEPEDPRAIRLAWSVPTSSAEVSLRGASIRRRLFYRMDARPAPGTTSFDWNSSVLFGNRIPSTNVGLLASTQALVGEVEETVYLPIIASQDEVGEACGRYWVTVWTNVSLDDPSITVASATEGRVVVEDEPLPLRSVNANSPALFAVPTLGDPGFYRIVVSADSPVTDVPQLAFVIYHPGNPASCPLSP